MGDKAQKWGGSKVWGHHRNKTLRASGTCWIEHMQNATTRLVKKTTVFTQHLQNMNVDQIKQCILDKVSKLYFAINTNQRKLYKEEKLQIC